MDIPENLKEICRDENISESDRITKLLESMSDNAGNFPGEKIKRKSANWEILSQFTIEELEKEVEVRKAIELKLSQLTTEEIGNISKYMRKNLKDEEL